jgi:hypothetical protein
MRHMIEHLRGIYHDFLFLLFSLHLLLQSLHLGNKMDCGVRLFSSVSFWFGLDWWFFFCLFASQLPT